MEGESFALSLFNASRLKHRSQDRFSTLVLIVLCRLLDKQGFDRPSAARSQESAKLAPRIRGAIDDGDRFFEQLERATRRSDRLKFSVGMLCPDWNVLEMHDM